MKIPNLASDSAVAEARERLAAVQADKRQSLRDLTAACAPAPPDGDERRAFLDRAAEAVLAGGTLEARPVATRPEAAEAARRLRVLDAAEKIGRSRLAEAESAAARAILEGERAAFAELARGIGAGVVALVDSVAAFRKWADDLERRGVAYTLAFDAPPSAIQGWAAPEGRAAVALEWLESVGALTPREAERAGKRAA